MDDHHRNANRSAWDELAPIHAKSEFYDIEGFLDGTSALRGFELAEMGEVAGRSLVHLQCHIGLDTLSWARRGADVVGLDFSRPAIEVARHVARRAGLDARFEVADVYDAVRALDRRFDLVYTGIGALCWLDDLPGWAKVVHDLLEPGGRLYLVEIHPFTDVFAKDELRVEHHYFDRGVPFRDETPGTYADRNAITRHNLTYEWTHTIDSVLSSLLNAGLKLESFAEHDFTVFKQFSDLEFDPTDRTFRFPPDHARLPLMYSLRAEKLDAAPTVGIADQ